MTQHPQTHSHPTEATSCSNEFKIDEDDTCPICANLLYEPVQTVCNHTFCKVCMVTWADTMPRYAEAPERHAPNDADPQELEVTCPACRTKTAANSNAERADLLKQKYPEAYAQRRVEAQEEIDPDMQYMTLYVGNKHQRPGYHTTNEHEWTFFIRTSRDEIIHSVFVHLHPSFTPSHVLLHAPPFELRRLGGVSFCVQATVILKRGWVWMNHEADTFERKKFLRLHWTLDLGSDQVWGDIGSMHRHRLKYRSERADDRRLFAEQLEASRLEGDEDDGDFAPSDEPDSSDDDDDDDDDVDDEMTDAGASSESDDDESDDGAPSAAEAIQCWEVEQQILESL